MIKQNTKSTRNITVVAQKKRKLTQNNFIMQFNIKLTRIVEITHKLHP